MPRPGHCPSCANPYDIANHIPMVSVVCGHSICSSCTHNPPVTPTTPRPSDAASTSSETSASDDDERPSTSLCPVCNQRLAGFVKNFEAIAALEKNPPQTTQNTNTTTITPTETTPAPDLTTVLHEDLVIDAKQITFTRSPKNEVGRGASAVVYKGMYDIKPVAVKCIRTMSSTFATDDRLRRELRNASMLKNAHIVEFRAAAWDFEAGEGSPRNILIVTELMAGGNLRESLNTIASSGYGLDVESFIPIALQIARGIEYLHGEGLAHRDIKSANILLTEGLSQAIPRFAKGVKAKIADFGLSKYIDKATGGGTIMQSIMEPGRLEATYAYLAPEAFGGDKSNVIRRADLDDDDDDGRVDETAKKRDIYALGVLFWEMLTGGIPWAGVSLPDVYVRVCVRSDRPGPALDDNRVTKTIRRLVERCWHQTPSRRPSARSIVAKLEKLAIRHNVADPIDPVTVAAVESVSIVSGQAPTTPAIANAAGSLPDMQSEPPREQRDLTQQRAPSESLMSYHKMPSASTVYTTQNEESKTHSTGFEGDARDLDIPNQFEDGVWVDDNDVNVKKQVPPSTQQRPYPVSGANGEATNVPLNTTAVQSTPVHSHSQPAVGTTNTPTADQPTSTNPTGNTDPPENSNAPSSRRRLPRARLSMFENANESNHFSNQQQNGHSQSYNTLSPSFQQNANGASGQGKSVATAVAATAAAIAAAKDRERKREDNRRVAAVNPRIVRGPNQHAAIATAAGGETSYQSLPAGADVWQMRGTARERLEQRAMFYDNSDEEAEDFDPERAAAEEAIAEANHRTTQPQQPSQQPAASRYPNNATRSVSQVHRATSVNRVARPKSPVVRRPMSPAPARPFSPIASQGKLATEEDNNFQRTTTNSLPRTSDPAAPRQSPSVNRGRLGRTMSASAPQHAAAVTARPATPVIMSSVSQSAMHTSDTPQKRPFIRRMRSNETSRRMARSSSTTGVEKRANPMGLKSSPSPASESHAVDDENSEYTTVVQIGSGNNEDYQATVDKLDKAGLLALVQQRMAPIRLAGLAHAALVSPKHRCEEEVLRNLCAALHKLTVPTKASSKSGSEISQKDQQTVRRYLKSVRAVEALLHAMHPPRARHPTTLSYGLLALGNLTALDVESHKQFRGSRGVGLLTEAMKTFQDHAGIQEKGCYALACVGASYPARSKKIFKETGALKVVITALSGVQADLSHEPVVKQACAALGAMCSACPTNAAFAGKYDALSYLVTAFERFRKASRDDGGKRSEMRLVCKAFMDLLCHDDNRKLAGSKGGSTMMLKALRIFRLDPDFVLKGISTLSEFCRHGPNSSQIVQADGIDDIVACMERFRTSEVIQRDGCRVLTKLMNTTGDQARRRLVHAGGAEVLVFALDRFGVIPESNTQAVIEICTALATLFGMENAAEGEILGRRMKRIKCDKALKAAQVTHKTDEVIQEKAREAQKLLSTLKGGGLFGRMRSGSRKR